jgi:Flp pilus assembly protein TadD
MSLRVFDHHWCVLATALSLILPAAAAAQQATKEYDVEGIYLKAYMLVQDAEKLENQANFAGAYFKYKESSDILDSVARGYPNWRPTMVSFRRNLVRKKMEETKQRERDRRNTAVGAAPGRPGSPPELLPSPEATNASFSEPARPPSAATVRPALPASPGTAAVEGQLGSLQERITGFSSQSDDIQRQLQARETELFQVNQDLLTSRREYNEALRKQVDLQNKVDTADRKREREVGEIKKQLEAATAALEKAKGVESEATTKIDAILAELASARATIAQFAKEKEQLIVERNQMAALVESKGGSAGADALLAENKRLKQELDAATAKVVTLQKDKETAVKEAAGLREQIAKVRDELDRTKKENEDYRQQIAGLRSKLEAANERLADLAPSTMPDSELAMENRELRKMILDQLKQQTFREEKKRLALEQLAKLQINNEELLTTIDQLAAPPAALSAEETQRIQDPVISEFMNKQALSGTIVAKADGQASPARPVRGRQELNADLQTVAEAGLAAYRTGRVSEAGRSFQVILRDDPTNVFALSNLAVVQVKQENFPAAEKTLKKALAYNEQDAFCHYLLGLTHYRQGKLEEAATSLVNALEFEPRNARAHFTLGLVFNRRGEVIEARNQFLEAVSIEPTYADAHYNLAIIYVRQGDPDQAASHYRKAVENGSERDMELEKLLDRPVATR